MEVKIIRQWLACAYDDDSQLYAHNQIFLFEKV